MMMIIMMMLAFVLLMTPTLCLAWTFVSTTTRTRTKTSTIRIRTTHVHHTTPLSSSSSRLLLHGSINPTSSSTTRSNKKKILPVRGGGEQRGAAVISFGQWLLERALDSPLWEHVLVPQARQKIVETAKANGIAWDLCKSWLKSQEGPWNNMNDDDNNENDNDESTQTNMIESMMSMNMNMNMSMIPDYYKNAPYHAYAQGNLCWEAALEVEIASKAVGARNFPAFGKNGEEAFRDSFGVALDEITGVASASTSSITSITDIAAVSQKKEDEKEEEFIMVDLGCGTGMSTRWLARRYPQATKILGLDLSPYFIQVGKRLLELAPRQHDHDHDMRQQEKGTWVSNIEPDDRIEYVWGNAADTGLPDNYCHVVNLQFVAHELPVSVTCDIIREAYRILKDSPPNNDNDNNGNGGGQLWFCEMDFESPGYAAQRANPLLFSLIRATEPYLDEYANHAAEIRTCLQETFDEVIITAATGRHFAICATKKQRAATAVAAQQDQEHNDNKDLSSNNNDNDDTTGTQNKSTRMGTLRDLRFDQHGEYRVKDTHLKVWENKV